MQGETVPLREKHKNGQLIRICNVITTENLTKIIAIFSIKKWEIWGNII